MRSIFLTTIEYSLFYLFTYFSSFPNNLFIQAKKNTNSCLTKIGFGLLNNQRIFWIANTGFFCLVYYPLPPFLQNKRMSFFIFYGMLQIHLGLRTIYFYQLLKKNIN